MNQKLRNIFNSELVRNTSILLSGNVIAQAIALLIYPILSRIYSESDFGIFATVTSVTGLLVIIGTGRYEEALVIAKDKKDTSLLLGFSLKLLLLVSFLSFLVLLFFRQPIFSFLNMESIEPYWYFISPIVLFSGFVFLLSNLATRDKKFKQLATSNVIQTGTNSGFRLILGLFSFTRLGLLFSNLIALILSIIPFYSFRKFVWKSLFTSQKEQNTLALEYKDFPIYNLGRNFLNLFSMNLPFLFLIGTFGETKLGLYSLAFLVLSRPITLIVGSLFSTLFENIASYEREKKPIFPTIKKYWKSMLIYVLPCFVIAFIVAKPLFRIVFGEVWEESGLYFQYLLPSMFMMMMTSPISSILIVFNKQNKALGLEITYLLLRWIALSIGVYYVDFQLGILLFSLSGAFLNLGVWIWQYSIIKKYEKNRCL